MEWNVVVAVSGLVATCIGQMVIGAKKDARHLAHVERLERMLASKDAGDLAAIERAFASPQPAVNPQKPPPSEEDLMWADPPKRKGEDRA